MMTNRETVIPNRNPPCGYNVVLALAEVTTPNICGGLCLCERVADERADREQEPPLRRDGAGPGVHCRASIGESAFPGDLPRPPAAPFPAGAPRSR